MAIPVADRAAAALAELAKTNPEAAALAQAAIAGSVKTIRKNYRFTAGQADRLEAQAAAAGMSETDYIVYKCELGA